MHYIVFYSTALYYGIGIAFYCTVLYHMVLHCMYCIALYCIALYCIASHCIVFHCIVLYCIALYCIVLHCIVLYCIAGPRLHPQQDVQPRGDRPDGDPGHQHRPGAGLADGGEQLDIGRHTVKSWQVPVVVVAIRCLS